MLSCTGKILPEVRNIDDEICEALKDLVDTYAVTTNDDPPHPFNIDKWREYLADHPDGELKLLLIEKGFHLGLKEDVDKDKLSKRVHNYINTKEECLCEINRAKKELLKKQIVPGWGWYQMNFLCVPKKNGETGLLTEIRVARHGSYARASDVSLNDVVTEEARRMKLPQFEEYVLLMYAYKYASLRDLKDAFRQLLLTLDDSQYVQYSLFGLTFRDRCVAYGEAGAAACCQEFSLLIIWICENKLEEFKGKKNRMTVHVDDFLILANSGAEVRILAAAFDRLCAELGAKISVEKNEDAITRGIVHGFGFKISRELHELEDEFVKTVFVPLDKACDIITGSLILLTHKSGTGAALECLTGRIMHWSRLKRRAKVFCNGAIRHLHEHLRKMPKHKKQYTVFTVSDAWLRDISLFLRFFLTFREVTMASIIFEPSITLVTTSDASDTGGGFLCADRWYAYKFAVTPNCHGRIHANMHINLKEAHAVLMMIHHLRHMLTGRRIWLLVDNQVVMHALIKTWSGSVTLMDFTQEIALMLMRYCIEIRVDYIRSEFNELSDKLSRGDIEGFKRRAELMNFELEEQSGVDYYDHLRLTHSPIRLPGWMTDLGASLAHDLPPPNLAPEIKKFFVKNNHST